MLSFGDLVQRFREFTRVAASSSDETLGKSLINQAHYMLVQAGDLDFPEKIHNITTTAATYQYDLPPWYGTLSEAVFIDTDGTDADPPMREVKSWDEWYRLRSSPHSATRPTHYWIVKDSVGHSGWQIWFYPTPDTSSKTIRTVFTRRVAEMTATDYTTGTISVTAASAVVTGSGTTFTSAMASRSIQLPDGYWYDIETFTSTTSISINQTYPSATASGATYQLGEVPIVPEEHQDALWYYAVGTWWQRKRQFEDAAFYLGLFKDSMNEMKALTQSKTHGVFLTEDDDLGHRHKNDYPDAVS